MGTVVAVAVFVLWFVPVLWRELLGLLFLEDLLSFDLVLLLEDEDCGLFLLSLERGSCSFVCSFGFLKSNSKFNVLEC